MENTQIPPIVYPTFKVDGVTYLLKFDFAAMFLLDQEGFDASDLRKLSDPNAKGNVSLITRLGAAMLGTMDAAGEFHHLGITPLRLAEKVGSFKDLAQAVVQAIAKVQPATPGQVAPAETEARPS